MSEYLLRSLELQRALARAFHVRGVPILPGTDSPFDLVVQGFSLHDELANSKTVDPELRALLTSLAEDIDGVLHPAAPPPAPGDETLTERATGVRQQFEEEHPQLAAIIGRIAGFTVIGNVQGSGLFWGLDLVADRSTREPVAYADAKRLASALRRRGILAGVTGRYTNVLKLRPPLVFRPEHVDMLVGTLDDVLSTFELRGGDDVRALGAEW